MSFLSEILLKGQKNAQTIKNSLYGYQSMPKEKLVEQLPSLILRLRNGSENLITHADPKKRIEDYLDAKGYLIKSNSLELKMSLGQYGLYEINIEGEIYNLASVDKSKLSELFVIGRSYDLFFGWGNHISYSKTRFDSFSMWIPCKLATIKINRVDYKRYSFTMQLYNDIQSVESELDFRYLGIVIVKSDIKIQETLYVNTSRGIRKGIVGEENAYTSFKKLCELLSDKLKYIKSDDQNDIWLFKEIEFVYGNMENVNLEYFSTTPRLPPNIANIKIFLSQIQVSPFIGNLKSVLTNLLNLLPDELRTRISYYIDETNDKTTIIFYDSKEFEDTSDDDTGITFIMNQKNSIIKEISFTYEQPLYSLALLRTFKDGKMEYSDTHEDVARNICKKLGINFDRFKELAAKAGHVKEFSNYVDIIAGYKSNQKEQIDGTAATNSSGNTTSNGKSPIQTSVEKIGNKLVQFFGVKCELTIRGFTGIFPAQKVKIVGDALFDGDYLVYELHHRLTSDGFDTVLTLLMVLPSDRMGIILGNSIE